MRHCLSKYLPLEMQLSSARGIKTAAAVIERMRNRDQKREFLLFLFFPFSSHTFPIFFSLRGVNLG